MVGFRFGCLLMALKRFGFVYIRVMLCAVCASITAQSGAFAQGGVVSGQVLVEGVRLPASGVVVSMSGAFRDGKAQVLRDTRTDDTGRFTFERLAGDSYSVCVQMPVGIYVNPCAWDGPSVIALEEGEKKTDIIVWLKLGRPIEVEVDDPLDLMAANEGKVGGKFMVVRAITRNGESVPLLTSSRGVGKRSFRVTIPFDVPVGLEVRGFGLAVEDESGRALGRNEPSQDIRATKGESTVRKFRFKIKGVEGQ